MVKSERFQPPFCLVLGLLAGFVLTGCSSISWKKCECPEATVELIRDEADIQRINELEHQLSDRQRQLSEKQRQSLEEKRRLERLLKESQNRSDELQAKLEAILAIDREMRRGTKNVE